MRKIKSIILHVSDSPDDLDIGAKEIREWHLQKGWSDIGYHYVIKKNGEIEIGRELEKPGAHVRGHNVDSIGICWVGRQNITNKAYAALTHLLLNLLDKYNLSCQNILGHYEINPKKTCPNIEMEDYRNYIGKLRYEIK